MYTRYRWNIKSSLGYLPLILGVGIVFVCFGMSLFWTIQSRHISGPDLVTVWLFGVGTCIFGLGALFLLLIPLSQLIFGYVTISSDGLEYRRWPFTKIFCPWNDVESIHMGNVQGLKYATLLIRRARPGLELRIGNNTLGSAKYRMIPISELRGWSDGSLLMDLRLHAPQLEVVQHQAV